MNRGRLVCPRLLIPQLDHHKVQTRESTEYLEAQKCPYDDTTCMNSRHHLTPPSRMPSRHRSVSNAAGILWSEFPGQSSHPCCGRSAAAGRAQRGLAEPAKAFLRAEQCWYARHYNSFLLLQAGCPLNTALPYGQHNSSPSRLPFVTCMQHCQDQHEG